MALYYDAASVLSSTEISGSFKSRIYNNTTLKSKPAQIYALISETAKRDVFLKEVIENANLLDSEPRLTPLLAILLSHDHFFSKSGIAAPAKHPLRQSIERHKARLQSEFTRARLRRRCGSTEALKVALDTEKGAQVKIHPRWVRLNTIKAPDVSRLTCSLRSCKEKSSLTQIVEDTKTISYCHDQNVPNLFAFSPNADLTSTDAYKNGEAILQDKASCFPAHLLLSEQSPDTIGDIIDGCAAPGNKTTHLAAIAHEIDARGRIFACERDPGRSKTLQNMVAKAGADQVEVLARQDFLALDPQGPRFAKVTHLLLDPSCSGSGILGREDMPKLALPTDPRTRGQTDSTKNGTKITQTTPVNKKRKRNGHVEKDVPSQTTEALPADEDIDPQIDEETPSNPTDVTHSRLIKLSNLQTRIVEHAMSFPSAKRITYSTCSIHELENEIVVSRILRSNVAQTRGWRILTREKQASGLRDWKNRGVKSSGEGDTTPVAGAVDRGADVEDNENEYVNGLDEAELGACIRCSPDDGEGTMGFFVCGFVRDQGEAESRSDDDEDREKHVAEKIDEGEWGGFD